MLAENDKGESTMKLKKGNKQARGRKRKSAGRKSIAELMAK